MDSDQLEKYLACMCRPKNVGYAVIASDEFEKLVLDKFPFFVIFNESPRSHSGTHWCVAHFKTRHSRIECHLFDSFGVSMKKKNIEFNFVVNSENLEQLQSNYSSVCGQWCLYWVYSKLNNIGLDTFLSQFSSDHAQNDKIVSNFGKKLAKCCKCRCKSTQKTISCVARLVNL